MLDTAEQSPAHHTDAAAETSSKVLTEPEHGTPDVIDTEEGLHRAARILAAGTGPLAIDAERASGFRYGQRAFLVQLKRADTEIFLIDPEAFDSLAQLQQAIAGTEWILHAANQDLPCLAELGLYPGSLFDTEVGSRIAGLPKVGLGAVVEYFLNIRLAKEHSAADWSQRPLPAEWLRYAALDVELLIPLRDALAELLKQQGKTEWATEEFEHIRTHLPQRPPQEHRWRGTSRITMLKTPAQFSALHHLWWARENLASERDLAPSYLLPDSALAYAALASPTRVGALLRVKGFHGRFARTEADRWVQAIQAGLDDAYPPAKPPPSGKPPSPRLWKERDPWAYRQLRTAKLRIERKAHEIGVLPDTLLTPQTLKNICWNPPQRLDLETVSAELSSLGARYWQIQQVAAIITVAMLEPETVDELTAPGAASSS